MSLVNIDRKRHFHVVNALHFLPEYLGAAVSAGGIRLDDKFIVDLQYKLVPEVSQLSDGGRR